MQTFRFQLHLAARLAHRRNQISDADFATLQNAIDNPERTIDDGRGGRATVNVLDEAERGFIIDAQDAGHAPKGSFESVRGRVDWPTLFQRILKALPTIIAIINQFVPTPIPVPVIPTPPAAGEDAAK